MTTPGQGDPVALLEKLVTLATLQTDLQRATNQLLATAGKGGTAYGQGPTGGAGNAQDMDRVFSKYFGRESNEIDVQKGLGRYAGKAGRRAWNRSRTRAWGKQGGKVAMGLARTLGLGKRATKGMGLAGAIAGKAVGAVTSLVEAFVGARNAVHGWTEGVFASAARLEQFSGAMSQVLAEREVAQIKRDLERGERTAGSASKLQEAEAARKIQENQLAIVADNVVNTLLTGLNQAITPVLELINRGLEATIEGLSRIPVIGDDIKKILKGEDVGPGSFVQVGQGAADAAREMDDAGRNLMAIARAAAAEAGRTSAPPGAAPLGRLP